MDRWMVGLMESPKSNAPKIHQSNNPENHKLCPLNTGHD